jgi:hypothetical protein
MVYTTSTSLQCLLCLVSAVVCAFILLTFQCHHVPLFVSSVQSACTTRATMHMRSKATTTLQSTAVHSHASYAIEQLLNLLFVHCVQHAAPVCM